MENPRISIVVPVYNVEKYIGRCIESIQNQTFTDYEVMVVDDKTPDNSIQIVSQYAQSDSRIRIVHNEENCGLMWARRVGVENSVSDYIVFLDSDDTLPKDALRQLYDFTTKGGYDIVSGNIQYQKADGSVELWKSSLPFGVEVDDIFKALLLNKYRHNLCGHIFTRTLLLDYSYKIFKNFTKWEDYCLFYQLVPNISKIGHIDVPVYVYYQILSSSSQAKMSDRSIETSIISHEVSYELLKNYEGLHNLVFRNFQYCFYNLYIKSPEKKQLIDNLLVDHNLSHIMKINNLFKYNRLSQAIKLLVSKSELVIGLINKLR